MRSILVALFVVMLPIAGMAKDKTDPSSYTLTAVVDSSFTVTSTDKKPGTGDPRCYNVTVLMTDATARAYCEATSVPVPSSYARLDAKIGGERYILHGKVLLPANTYKARFLGKKGKPSDVEFLVPDEKGNPIAVKFTIVAVLKLKSGLPGVS
jgi:hypothetical protein